MPYRDPAKAAESHKRYREKHREQLREQDRALYQKNREELLRKGKIYREKNKETRNAVDRVSSFDRRKKIRHAALDHLGGKCVRCGFSDWRGLQIDHVNGNGTKERTDKKSFSAYYKRVMETEPNTVYQVLCANCNQIKRYERMEGCGVNSKTQKIPGGEDEPH